MIVGFVEGGERLGGASYANKLFELHVRLACKL